MKFFQKHRRQDPVFGLMEYAGSYWEGNADFPFDPPHLAVAVRGGKDDDMAIQRQFYKEFVSDWPQLKPVVFAFISKQNWKLHPESSEGQLKLGAVTIPKGSLVDAEWNLVFDGATPDGAVMTIHMKGREPYSFAVDD